jgi:hypothetical protein
MDDALSEKLCARLTGTIAKKSADNFYKDFLLHNNSICASEGAKTRYSKKSEKNFLKIRCLLQNSEHFCLQVLEKS